jgi:hypothetical protein
MLPGVIAILPGCGRYHSFGFTLPPNSSLRTDGVYIIQTFYSDDSGKQIPEKPVYAFVRFFPDGRCYYSHDRDGYASTRDFASLSEDAGEQTYYRMTGDTVVVQFRVNGQFRHRIFHLQTDSLCIVAETRWGMLDLQSRRYEACMNNPRFLVYRAADLTNQPDW